MNIEGEIYCEKCLYGITCICLISLLAGAKRKWKSRIDVKRGKKTAFYLSR